MSVHILHVPFGYFPDVRGGTEVYVKQLVSELAQLKCTSTIAAPGDRRETYHHEGTPVHRFTGQPQNDVEPASGIVSSARQFADIIEQTKPDVVHLHAKSPAVSVRIVELCNQAGIPVVSTYHTPTASCNRGDLILFGREPCDGFLDATRCSGCVLQSLGTGEVVGQLLARLPTTLTQTSARIFTGKVRTMLLQPGLTDTRLESTRKFWESSDRILALSLWTRDLLIRNGVNKAKLVHIPHGIPRVSASPRIQSTTPPFQFAYFGRLSSEKGLGIVFEALKRLKEKQIVLDIYGIPDGGFPNQKSLDRLIADNKVNIMTPVPVEDVGTTMLKYSAVVIPSQWFETGPLVALEAIANDVPVLGSDLGGIAEMAARYGGVQLIKDYRNPEAWQEALSQPLCPAPRTNDSVNTSADVARSHLDVYASVLRP